MHPDFSGLVKKDDALARMFEKWTPVPTVETVPLIESSGRVLAEDQFAQYNLPVVRASTMDGIAVKSACFADGIPNTGSWTLGIDYVRADTGDDFDDAYDAVIAIEDVTFPEAGGIALSDGLQVKAGMNVKPCGKDVKQGSLLARKGCVLRPQDTAAIAMGGQASVPVLRKPRVAFLPTGSELIEVGKPLSRGQNFDTNSVMVAQMLREMGAEPILYPICPDKPESIRSAIADLLPQADIVLVNAGTSKGGEDYCARILKEYGEVLFHGVAAVPGRPMSMALIDGKPVVNLSGPSFAAFYSVDWAIRALVCRYLNVPVPVREQVTASLTQRFQTPPFFSMMSAFHVERRADGGYDASPVPLRGPKAAGSAAALTANAVYISALGEKAHEAGELIALELTTNRSWL